ncbi:hypothetical protein QQP08_017688 [Theobroma cacao]|nr:hypothetical protein QQP08_017386 [Theobroma cacao]WRX25201.1 hypothetical protein QQP08_017688 [Theobroma cacao]
MDHKTSSHLCSEMIKINELPQWSARALLAAKLQMLKERESHRQNPTSKASPKKEEKEETVSPLPSQRYLAKKHRFFISDRDMLFKHLNMLGLHLDR